jgi:general stress protein YciG
MSRQKFHRRIIMASKRGFAAMSEERRREIASRGGKAAQASGKAHHFTAEEASAAGRKGGVIAHERGTAHEFTPEEASAAGKKGGRGRIRGGVYGLSRS